MDVLGVLIEFGIFHYDLKLIHRFNKIENKYIRKQCEKFMNENEYQDYKSFKPGMKLIRYPSFSEKGNLKHTPIPPGVLGISNAFWTDNPPDLTGLRKIFFRKDFNSPVILPKGLKSLKMRRHDDFLPDLPPSLEYIDLNLRNLRETLIIPENITYGTIYALNIYSTVIFPNKNLSPIFIHLYEGISNIELPENVKEITVMYYHDSTFIIPNYLNKVETTYGEDTLYYDIRDSSKFRLVCSELHGNIILPSKTEIINIYCSKLTHFDFSSLKNLRSIKYVKDYETKTSHIYFVTTFT